MSPLDQYFEAQEEPMKGCLLAIKDCMLRYDDRIVMTWKWRTPFFFFGKEMLAYMSIQKKTGRPYLGFGWGQNLQHPALLKEDRKMIKVYYMNAEDDLDIKTLYEILDETVGCLKSKKSRDRRT
ncbi:MAG: hypothetical protein ACI83W_002056 [Marinoscillum sp.]|jgi:hypothetical protein